MRRLIPVFLIFFIASASYAFHAVEEVGPLRVEVFAPDWIWQTESAGSRVGSDINVLVTVKNVSDATIQYGLGFRTPDCNNGFVLGSRRIGDTVFFSNMKCGTATYNYGFFGVQDPTDKVHMQVPFVIWGGMPPMPSGHRTSFAMPACSALKSCPAGEHLFGVEIWRQYGRSFMCPQVALADRTVIEFPIRTIRGAAVSDRLWAKLLPAVIGLVWCGVVTLFMRRYIRPGTWRRTFAPETGEVR